MKKLEIQVIVFGRFSERIFNQMRYTGLVNLHTSDWISLLLTPAGIKIAKLMLLLFK